MNLTPNNNLFRRIITVAILLPLVILAIVLLPQFEFILLITAILMVAAWEWSQLIQLDSKSQKLFLLALLITFLLLGMLLSYFLLWIAFAWWLSVLVLFYFYSRNTRWWSQRAVRIAMGFLVFVPCWAGIVILHDYRPSYLLYVLFIIWASDTGAYFVGRQFGRHKLAVAISPGKTWEGFAGAFALALVVSVIGMLLLKLPLSHWIPMLGLTVITVIASVVGDLFESMIKRLAGVKDSGQWLPGHGGLLDRIDSVTCAVPIFALGMSLLHLYSVY